MASSSGRASVTPTPRRNVRRGSAILEINIDELLMRQNETGYRTIWNLLAGHLGVRRRLDLRTMRRPHLERRALHRTQDQRLEFVTAGRTVTDDLPHRRRIIVLEAAAERVDHQLLGDGGRELLGARSHPVPQAGRTRKPRAVWQRGGRIDDRVPVAGAPLAGGIEVLERKSQRVHARVTARAYRVGAMLLHPLSQRQHLAAALVVLERPGVRRRRWRRRAQHVVEDPLAAADDGGSIGEGGQREEAALPQQAATVLVGNRHAAEMAAVNVRNPVVFGQALVDERVVGSQKIEQAAVLAQHTLKEELRLAPEIPSQVLPEVREQELVWRRAFNRPELQPLAVEIHRERIRSRVRQHPADLPLDHARLS